MARGIHTRKRSRASSSKGRSFKRRRIVRRGRKTSAFTSQSGSGGGLGYKARKTSRSNWNKLLWNASLMSTHYRAVNAQVFFPSTPANATQLQAISSTALSNGSAFWTAGGGAINPDGSNALPTFTGNLLIRGGIMGCRLTNAVDGTAANQNTIHGMIFLIKTTKDWTPATVNAIVSVGWDPSYVQDFNTKVGKIVYKRNFLLKDTDTTLVEYRHKIRKVDEADYFATYNQYVWVVLAGTVDAHVSRAFAFTTYYNLSFCGDSV